MTKSEKSIIIRIAGMVILSIVCMITSTIILRPCVDSVTKLLLSLPDYSSVKECPPANAYLNFNSNDISEMRIFKADDNTSHEFAVIKLHRFSDANAAISVLRQRANEIISQFQDNPEELLRAKYFRIIYIDGFIIFTVYDTNSTAENTVHSYFSKQP